MPRGSAVLRSGQRERFREREEAGARWRLGPARPARRRRNRVCDLERADRGAAQLQAVGIAEICDQRAHVGARAALDREARTRPLSRRTRLAPELLEACHRDDPLGHLEDLAPACPPVGALAAALDRRVSGRALADLAGGQERRGGGGPPRLPDPPPRAPPPPETRRARARLRRLW